MEDIEAVNEVIPEYIGFVFTKSKREVTPEEAKVLRQNLDRRIQVVGVFVNEEIGKMVDLVEQGIIDMIQLHGQETEKMIRVLKERTQVPVIKAISITSPDAIKTWQKTEADYLLCDGAKAGSGEVFDWEILKHKLSQPLFLAGGIKYENVEEAISQVHPFAIDMSSGIGTEGVKDPQIIREMIMRIRDEKR